MCCLANTSYSATERIDILRTKIDEMRLEYASLKSEVVIIDRKRKRARKRLRDRQKGERRILSCVEGMSEVGCSCSFGRRGRGKDRVIT